MLAAGKRKRRPICAEISDTPHASKEIIHTCGVGAPNRAPPAAPVKATRSSFTAPSSVTSSGSPSSDLFRKLGEKDDFQLGEGDVAVPEGLISPPAPDPVGLRAETGGLLSPPNFGGVRPKNKHKAAMGGVRPKNKHKAAMGKHATTSSSSFGSTVSYVSHPSNEVAVAKRQRSERKGPSRPQDTALADASSAMTWLKVTKMNALLNQKHLL